MARSSEDGSLTEIIPHGEGLDLEVSYAGSGGSWSSSKRRPRLPAAKKPIAGKSNVYVWDRDTGQISLVSVLNDETSPPAGAFAGPYDWMLTPTLPLTANRGGSAINYYTQDQHASLPTARASSSPRRAAANSISGSTPPLPRA